MLSQYRLNLIPLENGPDVTVYFMLGRTKTRALLSTISWKNTHATTKRRGLNVDEF